MSSRISQPLNVDCCSSIASVTSEMDSIKVLGAETIEHWAVDHLHSILFGKQFRVRIIDDGVHFGNRDAIQEFDHLISDLFGESHSPITQRDPKRFNMRNELKDGKADDLVGGIEDNQGSRQPWIRGNPAMALEDRFENIEIRAVEPGERHAVD